MKLKLDPMMNYKKAFSLIELSIVILVIGILIAGVIQGRSLLTKTRISQARQLTQSSPVAAVKDLVFWVEPSLSESFRDADIQSDSKEISYWRNINPQTSSAGSYSLGALSTPVPPTYQENGIGGLPSLFFDASADGSTSGDCLATDTLDNHFSSHKGFSVFLVAQPIEATTDYASLLDARSSSGPAAGYRFYKHQAHSAHRWYLQAGTGGGWFQPSPAINMTFNKPVIISFSHKNGTYTTAFTLKSGVEERSNVASYEVPSESSPFNLGCVQDDGPYYYDGLISEVIIYDRGLKDDELEDVTEYLMQKYEIRP